MTDSEFRKVALGGVMWCWRCGSAPGADGLEVSHVYPKGKFPEVRHDLDNVVPLCRKCHRWGHAHTQEFHRWFGTTFPERTARLVEKTGQTLKGLAGSPSSSESSRS